MSRARLQECLIALVWTRRTLARETGWSEGTVRKWLLGTAEIPDSVAVPLERLARFHERNPLPKRAV